MPDRIRTSAGRPTSRGAPARSGCPDARETAARAPREIDAARRWPDRTAASRPHRGIMLGDRAPPVGEREADRRGRPPVGSVFVGDAVRHVAGGDVLASRIRRACAGRRRRCRRRNARRISPLSRPPRNNASSIRMFHARSVRITRSCAGALRAVTSAVRIGLVSSGKSAWIRCRPARNSLNGPPVSGSQRRIRFALRERREPLLLVDALGLVGEQHRVAVERDPQTRRSRSLLTALGKIVAAAWPSSSARRTSPVIGGQEQVGAERRHVARRRLALGERGARDVEAVVLDRVEHAQARVGGVARQQDHLDVLLVGAIESQQLLHQHERRPGRKDLVLVLHLVAVIGIDARFGVDAVALAQVEQRPRLIATTSLPASDGRGIARL